MTYKPPLSFKKTLSKRTIIWLFLIFPLGLLGQVSLVKNINTTKDKRGADIRELTNGDSLLFFVARNRTTYYALYRTNGTEEGTFAIKSHNTEPRNLVYIDSILYYTVGHTIWQSNGTYEGTFQLITEHQSKWTVPANLIELNGALYFTVNHRDLGIELWTYNTGSGKFSVVKDILPGKSSSEPWHLTVANGYIYFSAIDGIHGREVWRSNGKNSGTSLVADIHPGISYSAINNFNAIGETMFFTATDSGSRNEIWKTRGTPATTQKVTDFSDDIYQHSPGNLTSFKGSLLFNRLSEKRKNNFLQYELWITNGTTSGTMMIKDDFLSEMIHPLAFKNNLYFGIVHNVMTKESELYKSDGTKFGTVSFKNLSFGFNGHNPHDFIKVGDYFYFIANDSTHGDELWKSDGLAKNTKMLKDINSGSEGSSISNLHEFNGVLYFTADNGQTGEELWKTDGTLEGTELVKNICEDELGSIIGDLVRSGDVAIFEAQTIDESIPKRHLWYTDGTSAGTIQITDSTHTIKSALLSHQQVITIGDSIYLALDDEIHGVELWLIDKKTWECRLLKDIRPGISDGGFRYPISFQGKVYFVADDGSGSELWTSDGSEEGTKIVKDIGLSKNSGVGHLFNAEDYILFTAYDTIHGQELWRSDGTESGTYLLKDINSGLSSSIHVPEFTLNRKNEVFFHANDGIHGKELWKTDGTADSTVMVADIVVGSNSSLAYYLTEVDGDIYFTARDAWHSKWLYKTDGTSSGTVPIKLINSIYVNGLFVVVDSLLYFDGRTTDNHHHLWRSDGSKEGTFPLIDYMGQLGYKGQLRMKGDYLYFVNYSDSLGLELWRSNGYLKGTHAITDVFEGVSGSDISSFILMDDYILLAASDGNANRELWRYDVCSTTKATLTDSATNYYIAPSGATMDTTGIWIDRIVNQNGCDSVIVIDLTITKQNNSIDSVSESQRLIHLFPNPTEGFLTIERDLEMGELHYLVYNAIGKQIQNGIIEPGIQTFKIELHNKGIHFIKVTSCDGTESIFKVIKI